MNTAPPDLRPIQTAAARGGTVHQLASSEVDAGKSGQVRLGTGPPHGFKKVLLALSAFFQPRSFLRTKIDGSTKGRCRGRSPIFYVQSEMLRGADVLAHQLRTASLSILLDWKGPRPASRWIHPMSRTWHSMPPTARPTLHHPLRDPQAILENGPAKKTSDASGRPCLQEQFL